MRHAREDLCRLRPSKAGADAGVPGQEPVVTGSAAAMASGALEAFVRAAALEIAPQRINAISHTVFAEA